MKVAVEYAIQRKVDGRYVDIDLYNLRTCAWSEPVDTWLDIIKQSYMWRRTKEKFASARIVERITVEKICEEGGAK